MYNLAEVLQLPLFVVEEMSAAEFTGWFQYFDIVNKDREKKTKKK